MRPAEVRQFCSLDETGRSLMRTAMSQLQLSARAYHRILKLARTIADLAGSGADPARAPGRGAAVPAAKYHGRTKRITSTMILLLKDKADTLQIQAMLEEYSRMIKLAVDIRRHILAGGGEMHADCELLLLENGSEQDDIWGANWYPAEQRIEFEALINIRPRLGNPSILIERGELGGRSDLPREILGSVL